MRYVKIYIYYTFYSCYHHIYRKENFIFSLFNIHKNLYIFYLTKEYPFFNSWTHKELVRICEDLIEETHNWGDIIYN